MFLVINGRSAAGFLFPLSPKEPHFVPQLQTVLKVHHDSRTTVHSMLPIRRKERRPVRAALSSIGEAFVAIWHSVMDETLQLLFKECDRERESLQKRRMDAAAMEYCSK
jgi:hypothetical protein